MITRNPGTTVSYSPTFGYDICSRRMSSQTRSEDRFDLSRWRIAGNGADMIRPDVMQAFVDSFDAAGFKAGAFCPSFGLAEATLAVSLMPPGEGIRLARARCRAVGKPSVLRSGQTAACGTASGSLPQGYEVAVDRCVGSHHRRWPRRQKHSESSSRSPSR